MAPARTTRGNASKGGQAAHGTRAPMGRAMPEETPERISSAKVARVLAGVIVVGVLAIQAVNWLSRRRSSRRRSLLNGPGAPRGGNGSKGGQATHATRRARVGVTPVTTGTRPDGDQERWAACGQLFPFAFPLSSSPVAHFLG